MAGNSYTLHAAPPSCCSGEVAAFAQSNGTKQQECIDINSVIRLYWARLIHGPWMYRNSTEIALLTEITLTIEGEKTKISLRC